MGWGAICGYWARIVDKIEAYVDDKNLSFEAEDCLEKIIENNVVDAEFGKYVAIKNIGILFEPALRLNLEVKIDSWSRSYVLMVNRDEGEIDDDIFYLKTKEQKEFKINLMGIVYKEIILGDTEI